MSKTEDITGQQFGRLTVIRPAARRDGESFWVCRCRCGNMTEVRGHSLRCGKTRSCGCLAAELREEAKARRNAKDLREHERELYRRHKDARKVRDRVRLENFPDKHRAKVKVGKSVKRGVLLAANNYLCASCGKIASDHHHPSYRNSDWLNVVPLCRSCHVRTHTRNLVVNFGAVVLRIGVVRIAIAG